MLDVYRQQALQPGTLTAMINWYRGLRYSQLLPKDLNTLPKIEIPTLMVWGEIDSALGVEMTYGTEEWVEDFTIRYLANVSHWVQQEAPEAVNEILEAWLLGQPVPGQAVSSERLEAGR